MYQFDDVLNQYILLINSTQDDKAIVSRNFLKLKVLINDIMMDFGPIKLDT